jgi:predicted Co/Zn/Cd cation transporter (cation efflux family)
LAFIVVLVLERTTWAPYLVYADPALVTILVLIVIPIPLRILKDNMREALMMAPKRDIQDEITSRFRQALEVYGLRDMHLRMVKTGRLISVMAHVLVPEHFRIERVKELDNIRAHINEAFQSYQPRVVIDVIFTEDPQWIQ